jgi:hypothetical protein
MSLPTPTALSSSTRYTPPGQRKVWWVPTISNKNTPTLAEMSAGTDVTGEVASMDGWSVSSDTQDAPDLGSKFVSQVSGAITAPSSSLNCYMSSTSTDIRSLLARGSAGFIVLPWDGAGSANKCDVFPVQVTAMPKQSSTTDVAQIQVQFAITSVPVENIAIPTS